MVVDQPEAAMSIVRAVSESQKVEPSFGCSDVEVLRQQGCSSVRGLAVWKTSPVPGWPAAT
jgi:hypothetical protein